MQSEDSYESRRLAAVFDQGGIENGFGAFAHPFNGFKNQIMSNQDDEYRSPQKPKRSNRRFPTL